MLRFDDLQLFVRAADLGSLSAAARVMDMLTAQRHTIVPTLLDTTNGEQATTDRCLGEWWIEDVSGSHGDPVITIAGHEFAEYFRRQQIARTWSGNLDPVHTLREMMHDATTAQEPDVLLDVLRGSTSALRVDVEWQARSVSVLQGFVPGRVAFDLEWDD